MNKFLVMIICLSFYTNLYGMKKFFTDYYDTKKNNSDVVSSLPAGYLCVGPVSGIITVKTTASKELREKFTRLGFAGNEPLLLAMAYGLKSDRWTINNYMFLDDKGNEWYCCSERFPYTMLSNKKEGDSIELEINNKSVQLQCKQLGSYYEPFAPAKRFEDILAEYRSKIEKNYVIKGGPEALLPTIKPNPYLSNIVDAIFVAGVFIIPLIKLRSMR